MAAKKKRTAGKKSSHRKGARYTQKQVKDFLDDARYYAGKKGWCTKANKNSKTKKGQNRCTNQRKVYAKLYDETLRRLNVLRRLKGKFNYMTDPYQ